MHERPALKTGLRLARLILALAVLVAIGSQLMVHIGAGYSVLNFFSYFTNLSNLFAAAVLLLVAADGSDGRHELLRFVSAVNMTIVGLVFAVLLRNVDLGALQPWVNVVLHYVMPVAVVLDWLIAPPQRRLTARDMLIALVFPALYLAYSLVRGSAIGWYPYPFLNPATAGGPGAVAAYAAGIAVTFGLASWALAAVARRTRGAAR